MNTRDIQLSRFTPHPPARGTKHVLIRAVNWIGDAVMSLAALREVRLLFPDSHLTLLARSWVCGLFEGQQLVDRVIPFESSQGRLGQLWNLPRTLRGFDLALLFPNAFQAALVPFLARIPERIGYDTEARRLLLTRHATPRIKKLRRHQIFYYLDLLYQTGISSVDYLHDRTFQPNIFLSPTPQGLKQSEALLQSSGVEPGRRLVAVNPGASFGPAKRWLTDRYALLADRLIGEENVEVLILGSPDELIIAREIQDQMEQRPRILTGRTTLSALIGIISRCELFITNDSGPMHLSAALNVPQIALFGSTDEVATGPFSRRAVVIHKHVECSPCLLRECPIDLRCFNRIEVDEVYEIARNHLNRA